MSQQAPQGEKWTPGPWGVEPENGTHEIGPSNWKLRVFAHNPGPDLDFHVAVVRNADTPTREANARLIAQAPQMYQVLQLAYRYLFTGEGPDEIDAAELATEIEAVLAAARGEQG